MVCSIGTPYTLVRDYAEENLQSQDQEIENSYWFGNGARELQLKDRVSPKEYQNLYLGRDKDGISLKQQQQNRGHTSGRDLTLSAPKSVSISCLVENKQELLIAHQQAVNKTLSYVEENCIFTRLGKGGRIKEQTNNLVAAVFNHQHSRNHDPHLHSHCVIFNLTQGRDSKWRTMDNRELYAQKMTIGMVYRHHLAQRLQQMGYSLNWNRDGTFEIANYSALQLEQFSSRRTEIINFAGVGSTTKEKARACLATRNTKQYINLDRQKEIESAWKDRLYSLSFSQTPLKPKLKIDTSLSAKNLVTNAIATRLAESEIALWNAQNTKTKFSEHELLREALIQGRGNYDIQQLSQTIKSHPDLLPTEDGKLTTTELLEQEKRQQQNSPSRTKIVDEVKAIFETSYQQQSIDLAFSDKFQLQTIPNRQDRIDSAISQYLTADWEHQLTLIVDTEEDKQELCRQVRQRLIQDQKLTYNAIATVALEPKQLSREEKLDPKNYQKGDAIKFNRDSKNFQGDRIYKVIGVDVENKTLTLTDRQQNKTSFPLNRYQNRQLFKVKKRELRNNELLRFSRNQYVNGNRVYAGQLCTIKEIKDSHHIKIQVNGKQTIVNADNLFFTEYGYAATINNYQTYSGRLNRCIYCPNSSKPKDLFQQDLIEMASLTKNSLSVYADKNHNVPQVSTNTNRTEFIMDDQTRDNSLFEIASSAKYLTTDKALAYNSQSLAIDKSTTINRSETGLTIKDNNKELIFDKNLKVEKNELSDKQIKDLSQKVKKEKEKAIQENRTQEIKRNVGLSL